MNEKCVIDRINGTYAIFLLVCVVGLTCRPRILSRLRKSIAVEAIVRCGEIIPVPRRVTVPQPDPTAPGASAVVVHRFAQRYRLVVVRATV